MRRGEFLASSAAGTLAAATPPKPRPRTVPGRLNILLLMSDQHRADCIGAYGNRAIHTPHLDALAADGARFANAYSSTPTCTPARSALLTGMAPWNHGMLGYGRVAPRYPIELPRLLHDAGYFTAGVGKMHWWPQRVERGLSEMLLDESGRIETPDFRSDYRSWFWSERPDLDPDATGLDWNDYRARPYALPERLHPTRWIGDAAVRFLEQYDRSEPFFLKVSFERPHSPYDPPKRWWNYYANADLLPAVGGAWAQKYRPRSDSSNEIWHGDVGAEQLRRSRRGYYGSVSFVDEQFGRVLDTLRRRGLYDRTLILYTADHGDMLGDHFLWRKGYAYQPSAHIPMLLRDPSAGLRGVVVDKCVEIRDILPTLLDAAGAPVPPEVDGKSLRVLACDPHAQWRPWIDLEHDVVYSVTNHWTALTDGHRKYIFSAFDGSEQFFDLDEDPTEVNDLAAAASRSSELTLWRERMVEHLAPRGKPWVVNGKLGIRRESQLYSPNFPANMAVASQTVSEFYRELKKSGAR